MFEAPRISFLKPYTTKTYNLHQSNFSLSINYQPTFKVPLFFDEQIEQKLLLSLSVLLGLRYIMNSKTKRHRLS